MLDARLASALRGEAGAPENWEKLMRNGMQQDFSWKESAKRYVELYERLLNSEFPPPR